MKIIGLMSGTSADGIDIGICDVSDDADTVQATLIHGTTLPYPDAIRQMILAACDPHASNARLISELNFKLAHFIAHSIHFYLADIDYFDEIDLIASHGQTIWHEVDDDGHVTSTLQIGTPSVIAEATGITTISNFRQRDVAAGGQGAPLTAYVDWLLLRDADKWRAIQNIGGIGNVSVLPPRNDDDSDLLSFDTGPGNVLIDSAMTILTDGAQHYDHKGQRAAAGDTNLAWLDDLLQHPYYVRQPPKTTGRELFSPQLARDYVAQGRERGLSDDDIIATLTALTAYSIYYAYEDFAPQPIDEVIIGGGGGKNVTLMYELRELFDDVPVITHADIGMDSDYKEALVFAVLAHETWHHRPATLPQQTGAQRAVVLGDITPARNYPALIRRTWQSDDDDDMRLLF